jgi:hypothetical protein
MREMKSGSIKRKKPIWRLRCRCENNIKIFLNIWYELGSTTAGKIYVSALVNRAS